MSKKWGGIRMAMVAGLALGLPACADTAATPGQPATPAASTVLDDQMLGQIKRGETKMDQVRALIGTAPIVNYQAGREIWVYQGVSQAGAGQARTVTVQYDEKGVVRNVGVTDLK
jgi:outer membrane protein assembly factor BamE (lipoprotein component of BamABCDE complex)